MALSLDREAYYHHVTRLYSNWQVRPRVRERAGGGPARRESGHGGSLPPTLNRPAAILKLSAGGGELTIRASVRNLSTN
uniref:Uncharacterized protein n=1 Tax=Pseudonaja textilis TaxID=8673 RepID=A0A670ZIZ6_PSETE